MATLLIAVGAGIAFLVAYHTYGKWLGEKVFRLAADTVCPSQRLRDDRDYVPTAKSIVFGHHFTSIAGTGPIVGPAIAVMWGWVPALLWVVFGSIFIGAVHDFGALVVSLRNNGQTVGDIAGRVLNRRVRMLFLLVLFMALTIVLAIFGLVIAAVFRLYPAAIFPCLVQVPIAVGIGLWLHRKGASILVPSVLALMVMYLTVICGDTGFLAQFNQSLKQWPTMQWVVVLLIYSYVASVLPVWTLLQPRDYINSLQLLTALALIVIGMAVAATMGGGAEGGRSLSIVAPAWDLEPSEAPFIFPFLFITIACGAISGFHCLVSSGTTSKQLSHEPDARFVGYGGMLTEGFLATLVILACVAGLGLGAPLTFSPVASDEGRVNPATERFSAATFRTDLREVKLEPTEPAAAPVEGEMPPATPPTRTAWQAQPRTLLVSHEGYAILERKAEKISVANSKEQRYVLHADEMNPILTPWPATASFLDTENDLRVTGSPESFTTRPEDQIIASVVGGGAWQTRYASWSSAKGLGAKVAAFVEGSANFLAALGIGHAVALALMGVLVASFAGTTLDTACRLQRYVVQELAATLLAPSDGPGEKTDRPLFAGGGQRLTRNPLTWLCNRHGATLFAIATAALMAAMPPPGQVWSLANAGKGGLILWPMFGATNQLLGGLAFLVIGFYLWRRKKPVWFLALPMVFMLVMPAWAMVWQLFVKGIGMPTSWLGAESRNWPLIIIATVTLLLEVWMIFEAVLMWPKVRGVVESQIDGGGLPQIPVAEGDHGGTV